MGGIVTGDRSGNPPEPSELAKYYPRRIEAHSPSFVKLIYSNDGTQLASFSHDNGASHIKLWDPDFEDLKWENRHSGHIDGSIKDSVLVLPLNSCPYAAFIDQEKLCIHNNRAFDKYKCTNHPSGPLAISPDGKLLVCAKNECTIEVWMANVTVGVWIPNPTDLDKANVAIVETDRPISSLIFSPNSKLLALASDEGLVEIWDMTAIVVVDMVMTNWGSTYVRKEFKLHKFHVKAGKLAVMFSSDSKMMTCASTGGQISRWDTSSPSSQKTLDDKTKYQAMAFTPDGKLFVSITSEANNFTIWSPTSGIKTVNIRNNTTDVLSVSSMVISPDSKLLATTSRNDTPILWNLHTGDQRQLLKGHGSPVRTLVFSPDSKQIATSSDDGEITLWDELCDFPADQRARVERKFDRDLDVVYQVYMKNAHGTLTEEKLDASYEARSTYLSTSKPHAYGRYNRYESLMKKREYERYDEEEDFDPYDRYEKDEQFEQNEQFKRYREPRLSRDALMVGAFFDLTGEKDLNDIVKRLMRYSYLGVALLAYDSSSDMIKRIEQSGVDLAYSKPYRQHDMLKVQNFYKKHGIGTERETLLPQISTLLPQIGSMDPTPEMKENLQTRAHRIQELSLWMLNSHMARPLARKLHDAEALEAAKEYIDLSWEIEKLHIATRAGFIAYANSDKYGLDPTDPDSYAYIVCWSRDGYDGGYNIQWSPQTRDDIRTMNAWASQDKAREQLALSEYMDMVDKYSGEDLGVDCIQEAMRKLKEEVGNN